MQVYIVKINIQLSIKLKLSLDVEIYMNTDDVLGFLAVSSHHAKFKKYF